MFVRAVFDTNVLVSAALSLGSSPFRCLALARSSVVESVTCEELLHEFQRILESKLGFPSERAREAVEEVRALSRVVSIQHALRVVAADPDDDKVLECALTGNASDIVTGDRRHLLPMGEYQGIRIVTSAEFLQRVLTS